MKLLPLFLIFYTNSAFSQTSAMKEAVYSAIEYESKIESNNHFNKWLKDQWNLSIAACLTKFKIKGPTTYKNIKLHSSGTFTSPENYEDFCSALKNGPSVQCFGPRSTEMPFTWPINGLSSNYLFLKKAVSEDTIANIGVKCNLVKDNFNTKQFYAGPAKIKWLQKPAKTKINTSSGPKNVNYGTIYFEIEGLTPKRNEKNMLLVPSNATPRAVIIVE